MHPEIYLIHVPFGNIRQVLNTFKIISSIQDPSDLMVILEPCYLILISREARRARGENNQASANVCDGYDIQWEDFAPNKIILSNIFCTHYSHTS